MLSPCGTSTDKTNLLEMISVSFPGGKTKKVTNFLHQPHFNLFIARIFFFNMSKIGY